MSKKLSKSSKGHEKKKKINPNFFGRFFPSFFFLRFRACLVSLHRQGELQNTQTNQQISVKSPRSGARGRPKKSLYSPVHFKSQTHSPSSRLSPPPENHLYVFGRFLVRAVQKRHNVFFVLSRFRVFLSDGRQEFKNTTKKCRGNW
jgi:hypothetical protein